jgi:hypothetical protein
MHSIFALRSMPAKHHRANTNRRRFHMHECTTINFFMQGQHSSTLQMNLRVELLHGVYRISVWWPSINDAIQRMATGKKNEHTSTFGE